MNVSAKSNTKIPWRRVIPIAVVALVMGYSYSRPTLQRWFNISLPVIIDQDRNDGARKPERSPSSAKGADDRYQVTLSTNTNSGDGKNSSVGNSKSAFALKEVGRDRYQTPAGLLYTMGPRGEHRIEHIMRHAKDQPNRPAHGVFLGGGSQDTVLKIIDDAYELVKTKSPRAKYESSQGKDKYDVDMQRKIGFEGGKKGQRSNQQPLNKVRMILDGNRVITAFPVR